MGDEPHWLSAEVDQWPKFLEEYLDCLHVGMKIESKDVEEVFGEEGTGEVVGTAADVGFSFEKSSSDSEEDVTAIVKPKHDPAATVNRPDKWEVKKAATPTPGGSCDRKHKRSRIQSEPVAPELPKPGVPNPRQSDGSSVERDQEQTQDDGEASGELRGGLTNSKIGAESLRGDIATRPEAGQKRKKTAGWKKAVAGMLTHGALFALNNPTLLRWQHAATPRKKK